MFSLFAGILTIHYILKKISLNYPNLAKFEACTNNFDKNLKQNGFELLKLALINSKKQFF